MAYNRKRKNSASVENGKTACFLHDKIKDEEFIKETINERKKGKRTSQERN